MYKNDEIIFDNVRVLDQAGSVVGDMPTSEGIKLARSRGLNLNLISFDKDPPTCVIANDEFITTLSQRYDKPLFNSEEDFSFDPTARPATIQVSLSIADEEYERKIDLLRKHLLDRRRCRVAIIRSDSRQSTIVEVRDLAERILGDIRDVAKLADSPEEVEDRLFVTPVILNIWPCDPEQTSPHTQIPKIEGKGEQYLLDSDDALEEHERTIRPRVDPRLVPARKDVISDD